MPKKMGKKMKMGKMMMKKSSGRMWSSKKMKKSMPRKMK